MITTVFETGLYRLDYDSWYGTCWYVRLKDDYVSLMNSGVEAQEEIDWAEELSKDKANSSVFNDIASEQEYQPRWTINPLEVKAHGQAF